jgi:hypothetical protein
VTTEIAVNAAGAFFGAIGAVSSAIAVYFAYGTVRFQRELARPFFMLRDFETRENVNDPEKPQLLTYSLQTSIENRGQSSARNMRMYICFYTKKLDGRMKVDPDAFAELRYGEQPAVLTAQVVWELAEKPHYVVLAITYDGATAPWMYIRKGHDDGRFPDRNHFLLRSDEYTSVAAHAARSIATLEGKK